MKAKFNALQHEALSTGGASELPEVLERTFYSARADEVARLLLGHWVLRRMATEAGVEVWCGGEIVETEAYLVGDPACHAYVRETPRNRTMWGPEGHAYVFNIYGAYRCFNPVCGPPGVAEAVLIRAMRPAFSLAEMMRRRPVKRERDLLSGPSKLCDALDISRAHDGLDLCDAASPLLLARNPNRDRFVREAGPVVVCTRIGLTRGADLPLRFYLQNDPNVSRQATAMQTISVEEVAS